MFRFHVFVFVILQISKNISLHKLANIIIFDIYDEDDQPEDELTEKMHTVSNNAVEYDFNIMNKKTFEKFHQLQNMSLRMVEHDKADDDDDEVELLMGRLATMTDEADETGSKNTHNKQQLMDIVI